MSKSEMVVRVAEAIGCIDADRCSRFTLRGRPRKGRELPCNGCLDAAWDAIKELREPTEAMIRACGEDDYYDSDSLRLENWQAMIDEALKD